MNTAPAHQPHTIDRNDLAIGVLSVTAVVLFVSLILVQATTTPALAGGMTAQGGGFVMTVGALTIGDEEIVYLVDTSSNKMVTYRFDPASRQIAVLQGVDLATIQPAARSGQPVKPVTPEPAKPKKP